ncbi:NAD(P)-dependent alcohol dehydrogenase [Sporosarcina limicola]|uniref:L-iditol 2-dehydrogenase n=1 Tax=Sporosarcina limicola TaxID=34101 RepID=A0A927MKD4_9BACL|nr:NAD(P)-dependent alcohol dehydrogenase [Sporosarcina limicola]MBE1555538.1 L-iditol 2-dehydrogenase [Sporosarcina limicola]
MKNVIVLNRGKEENSLPSKMKVAYLQGPSEVSVGQEDVPEVSGKDVLIKVMAVGICGSDIHYYTHGRIGQRMVQYPHIQGHECAGVVVATGSQVTRFKVGDRVAIEPGVTCQACRWCKEGRYNLCPDVQFLSTPPVKGAFVQYLKHREDFLFPIADTLSFENATLAEPLSVGLHAVRRGGLQPGASVVISGMGPVGLMTVIAAKAFGAKEIIVSDMEPLRLEIARKLGATKTIHIATANLAEAVEKSTFGLGVDMVLETSGNVKALQSSIELTKRGGTIVVIGFPAKEEVPLNVTLMLQKEIDLCSVYRYTNTYPLAISILESLGNQVGHVITDRYAIDEIQEAMNQAANNQSGSLKVMVFPN